MASGILDLPKLGAIVAPDSPQSIYRTEKQCREFVEFLGESDPAAGVMWFAAHLAAGMTTARDRRLDSLVAARCRAILKAVLPEPTIERLLKGE